MSHFCGCIDTVATVRQFDSLCDDPAKLQLQRFVALTLTLTLQH